jgi:hypothetical protein
LLHRGDQSGEDNAGATSASVELCMVYSIAWPKPKSFE